MDFDNRKKNAIRNMLMGETVRGDSYTQGALLNHIDLSVQCPHCLNRIKNTINPLDGNDRIIFNCDFCKTEIDFVVQAKSLEIRPNKELAGV